MSVMEFVPDYRNVVDAARNRRPARLPLYEHIIAPEKIEEIRGSRFVDLYKGNYGDKKEYFRRFCAFWRDMGYDTVSYEACATLVIQGGECLSGRIPGLIRDRSDFEAFDFRGIEERFWARFDEDFRALAEVMPEGMKGLGGIGNGLFEIVQDLVGYTDLCLMSADDPELYAAVFARVGDLMVSLWRRFLERRAEVYAVCRFGDDLGFKSSTLLSPGDIRSHIVPQYRRVVDLVHAAGKPFLLHSCGRIFDVMDDIIERGRIDAKHSNEDQIAPFPVWVERYGSRIGLFGGIDMDVLCRRSEDEIREYTRDVIARSASQAGLALGSGNSIPDYVPAAGYLAMVNTVRESRGDFA
ncbi:MAG TPA: uroporphyrinogen decarboxylase family protein [Rectinemataceae bacterium]|nr:uroporphyrinogen decarboxylase family protein [Rectinemataceae bacterium]